MTTCSVRNSVGGPAANSVDEPPAVVVMNRPNPASRGCAAVRGRVRDYVSYPVPWVSANDVATAVVKAIDLGKPGDSYLAFGREDATTTAAFLNVACEVAGVDHRVAEVTIDPNDTAAAIERYGQTLVDLAQRRFPVPWFDNAYTRSQLGYEPMPLREALTETVEWLRRIGKL